MLNAASRALSMADAPLSQMAGALSHNLALALTDEQAHVSTAQHAAPLLAAALAALAAEGALTDPDAFGRALSTVGHLLATSEDEAFAVALSLDAPATLNAARERAAALGHSGLLDKVIGLLV